MVAVRVPERDCVCEGLCVRLCVMERESVCEREPLADGVAVGEPVCVALLVTLSEGLCVWLADPVQLGVTVALRV